MNIRDVGGELPSSRWPIRRQRHLRSTAAREKASRIGIARYAARIF